MVKDNTGMVKSCLPGIFAVVVVFDLWSLREKDKAIAVVTATQPTAKMTRQMKVSDFEDLLRPELPLPPGSSGVLSESSFPISQSAEQLLSHQVE